MNSLLALSPLDGRYKNKCGALNRICSELGLIYNRVQVEIEWFKALSANPDIAELPPLSNSAIKFLDNLIENFNEECAAEIKSIEQNTNHDVKAVEYFLAEKFKQHPELSENISFIHFACTSEDINNLAYALMVDNVKNEVIAKSISKILEKLDSIADDNKSVAMLARTHGQAASPTTLGKEFLNSWHRLQMQWQILEELPISAKINGAVGNFNAHNIAYPNVDWIKFSEKFVIDLGLDWNPLTTQIEPHDNLAEYLHILTRMNTIILDLCKDVWNYISIGYFIQKTSENEVGSSTMPHKVNPIDFENAEGNLGIANALCGHFASKLPVSRWQRDLSDSTVLRNLGVAFGHSVLAYNALLNGLDKLEVNHDVIHNDLNNHPEVLAEAIQTVMRKYKIKNAYEQLKTFSRGQSLDLKMLSEFIDTTTIPPEEKERLKKLKPSEYVGLAEAYFKL
jgi:adenylosuccinate lyase